MAPHFERLSKHESGKGPLVIKYDKIWGGHGAMWKGEEEKIKWVHAYPLFEGTHTSYGCTITWLMSG